MRKRITLLVVASVLAALAGMGAVSYLGVQRGINASLQGRLALAQVIAGSVDASLMNSVSMLQSLPARAFTGGDEDRSLAMELLERAYRFSIFGGGVCVYSPQGSLIAEIPPGAWAGVDITAMPEIARAMEGKGPIVSNLRPFGAEGRMGALVAAPIFDGAGVFSAVAAGRIDPDSGAFAKILQFAAGPAGARLEIIDQNGVIIFSSDKKRILAIGDHNQYIAGLIASGKPAVDECHSCHSGAGDGGSRIDETLVFTPLSAAPWGLAVIEPSDSVYSPAIGMRNAFVAMGLILVAVSALLALGLSESIVKPIHALIAATQLLARERFSEPIRLEHGGEIGALAQSFETMRARLAEAMAEVRQYGVELERRVMDRTHELEVQRQRLAVTLDQVIRAQEEERMRIARELHDETSQAILALGMGLEVAAMELRHKELSEEALLESKARANRLLEGIKRIIQDLRPPALDDLGLVSSIRWLLDSHLAQMGIQYIFTPPTAPVILDKGAELRLFRVVQEAVINIARHSGAQNAAISMRQDDGKLIVVISDDGAGFDAETVLMDIESGREAGFGLLGMRERLAQINGLMRIDSGAGRGTRITITMPVANGESGDEKDKDADS